MKTRLCASLLFLAAGLGAATVAPAQPMTASPPTPDTAQEAPGIPGPDATNPAPGARGPYVGAGKQGFYDVDQRIAALREGIGGLPAGQRRRATSQLHAIQSEEDFKRAKYGELRDWDREHLTVMLDHLVQQYPALSASASM